VRLRYRHVNPFRRWAQPREMNASLEQNTIPSTQETPDQCRAIKFRNDTVCDVLNKFWNIIQPTPFQVSAVRRLTFEPGRKLLFVRKTGEGKSAVMLGSSTLPPWGGGGGGVTIVIVPLQGLGTGGPGNLSIPIRFYYRIRELNF
jgi:hypothetical protein